MAVTQALIFAAGFGQRMRPLTETRPKPLLEVAARPLIDYHLEKLVACGVKRLVINSHWLADALVEALGDGQRYGAEIAWSHEPEILDTGGGMKNALPLLAEAPFVVVNGDIWTDYDFAALANRQLSPGSAHLVMVPNPGQHRAGDFGIDASGLLSADAEPKYTYAGLGLFTPEFIRRFGSGRPAFPLREALQAGMACGKVSAELYPGDWEDVGTPARLASLNQRLANHSL